MSFEDTPEPIKLLAAHLRLRGMDCISAAERLLYIKHSDRHARGAAYETVRRIQGQLADAIEDCERDMRKLPMIVSKPADEHQLDIEDGITSFEEFRRRQGAV
jgi:hypothetical protein